MNEERVHLNSWVMEDFVIEDSKVINCPERELEGRKGEGVTIFGFDLIKL